MRKPGIGVPSPAVPSVPGSDYPVFAPCRADDVDNEFGQGIYIIPIHQQTREEKMGRLVTVTAAVALMAACGGGGTPGDAVTGMFDALKAGDGETAVSYMSASALSEMDTQLEMLKANPEASSQQLALIGIEIDAGDIPDMTARDFAVAMISSPMMKSVMETAEVSIGEVTIEDDVARVEVTTTVMGESETHTIDVVREDGQWKVTEFGMNM
jgi:hypothetical protein